MVQEQNAFPSVTNRILARWVDDIHLALSAAKKYFNARSGMLNPKSVEDLAIHSERLGPARSGLLNPEHHIHVTGNPIRSEFGSAKENADYSEFGLASDRLTLTITGGSLGAHAINMAVLDALDQLEPLADKLQIIHQTGPEDYEQVRKRYERSKFKSLVRPYFDEIPKVYGLTDLMVCRAGGMTIAEISACGLPAILIPFPFATADHQRFNAQAMVDAGAAVLLLEDKLSGELLAQKIIEILNDPKRFEEMSDASKMIGKPDAAQKIAEMIFESYE